MIFVDRTRVHMRAYLMGREASSERERITFRPELRIQTQPALLELFHNKCTYCESPVGLTEPGDIEHFRPKILGDRVAGQGTPVHYGWLAYEWENLLIACAECNRVRMTRRDLRVEKGSIFPIVGNEL